VANRTREEIEEEIAFKTKSPGVSVGAVDGAIQRAILETLLGIRDGVEYMVESQKRYDRAAEAQAAGKLPPRE